MCMACIQGDLGKMYEHWSKALLHSMAHVEAVIDFGEDENIEEGVLPQGTTNVVDCYSVLSK